MASEDEGSRRIQPNAGPSDSTMHNSKARPYQGRWEPVAGLAVATAALIWLGGWALVDRSVLDTGVARLLTVIGAEPAAQSIVENGLPPGAAKPVLVLIAILIALGGTAVFFVASDRLLDFVGGRLARYARPWVFLLPSLGLLGLFLVYPIIRTVLLSLTERPADSGILANFVSVFTAPDTLVVFRNTAIWLVLVPLGALTVGLGFAVLVDRIRREAFAKTFIFIPVAISMVGAAVIFRFVYVWRPSGQPQIGAANAVLDSAGFEPVAFFQTPILNTVVLIGILVWIETGFAMVVFSAALKAVSEELIGAARIDGASEWGTFRHVVIPSIRGPIITVGTSIVIVALKIFDIVFVTTGGNFDSDVIANRMITELVKFRNPGRAAALAVVLMIATVPVMVINARNFKQERNL